MFWVLWLLVAYFMGAIPFGLLIAKYFKGIDPRLEGSKNTGGTNVARLCGTQYGVLTVALDVFKGFLPVYILTTIHDGWFFTTIIALTAILGHCYSVFLDMKGGKAVATSIGAFMAVSFVSTFWAVAALIAVIYFSGYVSLGSLTFAATLPVFALLSGNIAYVPLAAAITAILFLRHKENIIRLSRGEENPWTKTKMEEKVQEAKKAAEEVTTVAKKTVKKATAKKTTAAKKTTTTKKAPAKKAAPKKTTAKKAAPKKTTKKDD
ncbi:MAG: glycerol-3-phosphate 1-O-acyltransferase PlsY [Desulfovibrio sp.]